MILKNSKHVTKYVNYYNETSLYLVISNKDGKRGSYRSVCHEWTTHLNFLKVKIHKCNKMYHNGL